MDVFDLRSRLVEDYARYTRSFIKIADPRVKAKVDGALEDGALWPEPLLQLNPTFLPGGTIDDLVTDGTLHPECKKIFRIDKSDSDHSGKQLLLHAHQTEAIKKCKEGKSYVLTSGTGSGKSLTYIVPIVDHVLRRGSGKGVQAVVVYPMNALANSQSEELKKFLEKGYGAGHSPVRFARYTGQEKAHEREAIRSSPPDVLLTNYMMLELLLTRREDRALIKAAQGLRFLVFDELHTYRGRQGADVALLIRRCRMPPSMQPVVTFAFVTGWRINSEILPLQWRQVDLKAREVRLDPGTTKNLEGRVFYLPSELKELLKSQRKAADRIQRRKGMIVQHVFFHDVPTKDGEVGFWSGHAIAPSGFYHAWCRARISAGCPGSIPHDFRRTAIRNMVRAGIPERVAMKLSGHKTRSVFDRYNVVSDGDLREAARRLGHTGGHTSSALAASGQKNPQNP